MRRSIGVLPWWRAASSLLVVGALGAAGCSGGDDDVAPTTSIAVTTTTTPVRADDGQLVLGVYLPTTGPGAPLGVPMIAAVEDAVGLINEAGGVLDQRVVTIVVDESDDTGIETLLERGVDAIIGPASSTVALSQLGPTVDPTNGVVTCSPSATALSLDGYRDNNYFFRTVPSDSLQMAAIARRAERTGTASVAIGYLDDPYGRGLADALQVEIDDRNRLELLSEVGFSSDQEELGDIVAELLEDDPGVVIVLGDADDGSRLLAALDEATAGGPLPEIIVNDAIRSARQTIQSLTPAFREQITGIAPLATPTVSDGPEGFFSSYAVDCVNLIALATIQAGTDAPSRIRVEIPSVASEGRACDSFADCKTKLVDQGLLIDYNGASGGVEIANSTGDRSRGWFDVFTFGPEGGDETQSESPFQVG